jgi:hypothetical protein
VTANTPRRYVEAGWFTRQIFNKAVAGLTGLGISVWGTRILAVRGRKSGEWRTTPVNLLSRRAERFSATEVSDDAKPAILRAYLTRWKMEVGVFFGGVGPDAPDSELRRIAPDYPIFEITGQA